MRLPPILALAVVSLVALSVAAQPEIPISSIEYGPADRLQMRPLAAGNGDVLLSVWTTFDGLRSEMFAARVSRTGDILQSRRIAEDSSAAAVAWSGRYFLVARMATVPPYGAYLTRIDADGAVRGEVYFPGVTPMTLACHSTRCLLTVMSNNAWNRTLDAIVTYSDGQQVRREKIADVPADTNNVRSATNGADFLVSWNTWIPPRSRLFVTKIDSGGAAGQTRELGVTPAGFDSYTLVPDGNGYLLAYGQGQGIAIQRLSADGSPAGAPVSSAIPGFSPLGPLHLARIPGGFAGFGLDARAERFVTFRLTSNGSLNEAPSLISPSPVGGGDALDVSVADDRMLAVWTEWSSVTGGDAYARVFSTSGGPTTERVSVAESARPQRAPAIASSGSTLMSVWMEGVDSRWQIRMSLVRGLATIDLETSVHSSARAQTRPAVASNGDQFVVVWEELRSPGVAILARRFSRSGSPMGDPIDLSGNRCGTSGPAIASNGADFIVTWTDCNSTGNAPVVVASRIHDGIQVDRIELSAGSIHADSGDVAWNGVEYVVSWLDQRPRTDIACSTPCYWSTVRVSRISPTGVLSDPRGIAVSAEGAAARPRVVRTQSGVLVAWVEYPYALLGARMSTGGAPEAPRPLLRVDRLLHDFSIAWDGTRFVATWAPREDYRPADLMVAQITDAQLDAGETATPFTVAHTADREDAPVVIATGNGQVTIAYERLAREPQYGNASRVFVRTLHGSGDGRRRAVRR